MTSSSNDQADPDHAAPLLTPDAPPAPPRPLSDADWVAIWHELRECAVLFHEGLHRLNEIERRMHGAQPQRIRRIIAALPVRTDVKLTRREREILLLAGIGALNCEIGVVLDISEGTVKNHMTNILGKLGAHSRWEAVLRAREWGLI